MKAEIATARAAITRSVILVLIQPLFRENLRSCSGTYGETGTGEVPQIPPMMTGEAAPYGQEPGTFTAWRNLRALTCCS